jgi:cation transport regulator ChaB
LPEAARVLPKAGQTVWMKAFNEALDQGLPEDEASKMAWAAVKRAGYEKTNGKWSKSMDTTTVAELSELAIDHSDGTFVIGVPLMKIDVKKRLVGGFATLNNVDQAGDRITKDASVDAFGDWFGNIREMHQKKAVGKAVDWREDTLVDPETGIEYEGVWVTAKISKGAEDTWQKVLDGTLAGFSVGGATLEKQRDIVKDDDGNNRQIWTITKYKLTELSLVDNPCNRLATISLIKSVDGGVEIDDTIADGDIEKAHDGETGEFTSLEGPYRSVVAALEALRDEAIAVNADYEVACASEALSTWRRKAKWEGEEAKWDSERKEAQVAKSEDTTNKEATMSTEDTENTDPSLQKNEESDIPRETELTEADKGLFRKFVEFIKGEETSATESGEEAITKNEEDGETPDMNAEEVTKAIDEKSDELVKSVDEKFTGVGEALVKIEELLKTLATAEVVEAVKAELVEKVEELTGRVETVEKSGGIKKSGEEGEQPEAEKIEKSEDGGLWGGTILPDFLTKS